MRLSSVIICLLAITLGGCSRRMLTFTIISTKNFDYTQGATFSKYKERTEAKDMAHIIIIVPTKQITMNEAIDNAIEAIPGCVAITDGVIYYKWWYIPYVYGRESYVIKGIPLIDNTKISQKTEGPSYYKIELDNNGMLQKSSSISAESFFALESKLAPASKKATIGSAGKLQE